MKTKTLQATTAQAVQAEAETVEAQVLTLVRQELTVSVEAVAEALKPDHGFTRSSAAFTSLVEIICAFDTPTRRQPSSPPG